MAAVAYNLRMLRNWHERTGLGDDDHPLLRPDVETYGSCTSPRKKPTSRLASTTTGEPDGRG